MGAGGFTQKHGILLNKRWKRKILNTESVNQRMITTTIKCHHRRIELATVYFLLSGYTDVHIEKMYKCIKNHCNKKHTTIIAGAFNAQLGLGIDSERDYVGEHTTGQANKRGIWMKQWLMIQNYVALNTTFKRVPEKQATFRSASVKHKQLDYVVLIDKRSRRYCTDAEANDMIHLESDHRSVARFRFPRFKKIGGLNNEQTSSQTQRCKRQSAPMETREDPTERIHEIERRYDELDKRFAGKHEATTNERQK